MGLKDKTAARSLSNFSKGQQFKTKNRHWDNAATRSLSNLSEAKENVTEDNTATEGKLLSEKFNSDAIIRLTPEQKKNYRKQGYTDVDNYKTILAPNSIFRPNYKPIYSNSKSSSNSSTASNTDGNSGLGVLPAQTTPEALFGSKNPNMQNFDMANRFKWASQNPDAKVSVNQKSKGKSSGKPKFVSSTTTPTGIPFLSAAGSGATVENNPNAVAVTPKTETSKNTNTEKKTEYGIFGGIPYPKDWKSRIPYGYLFGKDESEKEKQSSPNQSTPYFTAPLGVDVNPDYEAIQKADQEIEKQSIFAKSKASADATFGNISQSIHSSNIPTEKKKVFFSKEQESIIERFVKLNPSLTRQQVIDTLSAHNKL